MGSHSLERRLDALQCNMDKTAERVRSGSAPLVLECHVPRGIEGVVIVAYRVGHSGRCRHLQRMLG